MTSIFELERQAVQTTPPKLDTSADNICVFEEVQLPITNEDGEILDCVIADVYFGYDFETSSVTLTFMGYWHGTRWYGADDPKVTDDERPLGMRYAEKLLTKKVFPEKELQNLLNDHPGFAYVRAELNRAAMSANAALTPNYI